MFQLPVREIGKRFTISELSLLAWRSGEYSRFLKSTMPDVDRGNKQSSSPKDLPAHFYDKDGNLDLRQVTGREAYSYFSSLGIQLPVIQKV